MRQPAIARGSPRQAWKLQGMSTSLPAVCCPHCKNELPDANANFCVRCGLALRQPCPGCSVELSTPPGDFTNCSSCNCSLWACQDCARVYHLDRTSCLNSYCPSKGKFWTSRFGNDTWEPRRGLQAIPTIHPADSALIPGWLAGGAKERRHPSLHHSGLVISVQETGVLELWAERGAPRPNEGDEFREESVCLVRLDLGQAASGRPLLHHGLPIILGNDALWVLELTSNPSLGSRVDIPGSQGPLRAVSLAETLLLLSPEGLWEVDPSTRSAHRISGQGADPTVEPVTDGISQTFYIGSDGHPRLHRLGSEPVRMEQPSWNAPPEWALHADRFLLFWRNQLGYHDEQGQFQTQELPATVVSRPVYDAQAERLILLLSDHTIRTCSTTGERFSFLCEMPGTPTTGALRLGSKVYYGSDGRYLCADEEAMLPRLNSAPWGELSYANGRLFGTTKEGQLFCFCL